MPFGWDHAGFILAAYAAALLVIVGLIVWVLVDGRRLRRQIAELENRGVRRRSSERSAS